MIFDYDAMKQKIGLYVVAFVQLDSSYAVASLRDAAIFWNGGNRINEKLAIGKDDAVSSSLPRITFLRNPDKVKPSRLFCFI